jgi:hypothetical protein
VYLYNDAEFAGSCAAAVASLQGVRYRNALTALDGAMSELSNAPPDCKVAIREWYSLPRKVCSGNFSKFTRLTAQEVQRLGPRLQGAHAGDNVANGAAKNT